MNKRKSHTQKRVFNTQHVAVSYGKVLALYCEVSTLNTGIIKKTFICEKESRVQSVASLGPPNTTMRDSLELSSTWIEYL